MLDATPLLRAWAARRRAALARMDPVQAQRETLRRLVRAAAGTRFGRAHGFADIGDVETYQHRVPLRRYEAFWEDFWGPAYPVLTDASWPGIIPAFALSSGTSGGPSKRIPVSAGMIASNRGAALDVMAHHLLARPASRVFGGRNLLLGGSTALATPAPGVREGDLSGIMANIPWWAAGRSFPPKRIALLGDWEAKIAALAPAALETDIRSVSGTPSWLLLFFDRLAELRPSLPRRLVSYFPNLELVVHGGVGFAPYRDRFAAWLEGGHAETREVYPASEGFVAFAGGAPGEGLRLEVDRGLFHEFVPVADLDSAAPDRRWLATADLGVEYALVVTSNAGLWSYVLGDTVALISRDPPLLRITGRTSFTLSMFGEHLVAEELDAAVTEAASSVGAGVVDYAAGAVLEGGSSRGRHVFVVELDRAADVQRFAAVLDSALARGNADYADHRRGDFGVLGPEVVLAPPGMFARWMARRGKLGGQNKVPRVIADPALLADLRDFAK